MQIDAPSTKDRTQIQSLVTAAFGQPDEAHLVDALCKSSDIAIELVASDHGKILGHILMSRLTSPDNCLALAPLAVLPDHQKNGIGAALVLAANKAALDLGATAVFVLGDPAYYGRFGYKTTRAEGFATPYPPEYMAALVLDEVEFQSLPRALDYSPAFCAVP